MYCTYVLPEVLSKVLKSIYLATFVLKHAMCKILKSIFINLPPYNYSTVLKLRISEYSPISIYTYSKILVTNKYLRRNSIKQLSYSLGIFLWVTYRAFRYDTVQKYWKCGSTEVRKYFRKYLHSYLRSTKVNLLSKYMYGSMDRSTSKVRKYFGSTEVASKVRK